MKKIFTRERIIYALIVSIFGFLGTWVTARSQASEKAQEELDTFKSSTIQDISNLKSEISGLKGTVDQMNNRLEDIKGINQSMQSRLNRFLDDR